ncbi:hypothetical protein Tsubulata_034920 [Turnera subulata]|uniref:Uncharacterized protein n=1 Tax=Turnera subulata TaxID=218843 RepID=A0A9Q0G5P4_9ROSI|nr:hypothetical protein Tsubulata_034920 [Turnera subulata]
MAICTVNFATLSSISGFKSSPFTSAPQKLQITAELENKGSNKRVWRRRKLTKVDLQKLREARIPFLDERVRIRDGPKLWGRDISILLRSEDSRYAFVNDVVAEAAEYEDNNPGGYGGKKKSILHVLSNRMNDAGIPRPEAYATILLKNENLF